MKNLFKILTATTCLFASNAHALTRDVSTKLTDKQRELQDSVVHAGAAQLNGMLAMFHLVKKVDCNPDAKDKSEFEEALKEAQKQDMFLGFLSLNLGVSYPKENNPIITLGEIEQHLGWDFDSESWDYSFEAGYDYGTRMLKQLSSTKDRKSVCETVNEMFDDATNTVKALSSDDLKIYLFHTFLTMTGDLESKFFTELRDMSYYGQSPQLNQIAIDKANEIYGVNYLNPINLELLQAENDMEASGDMEGMEPDIAANVLDNSATKKPSSLTNGNNVLEPEEAKSLIDFVDNMIENFLKGKHNHIGDQKRRLSDIFVDVCSGKRGVSQQTIDTTIATMEAHVLKETTRDLPIDSRVEKFLVDAELELKNSTRLPESLGPIAPIFMGLVVTACL